MKILTALQMGEVDRLSTAIHRIPSILLMENAGRAVADELAKVSTGSEPPRVVILCGKGNNGGDGLVVARYLALRGSRPEVILFADPAGLKGDALANWEIVQTLEIPVHISKAGAAARRLLDKVSIPDVVVDALFGTGLSKPLGREYRPIIDWINRVSSKTLVVSVDIPSGLFADSARVRGPAVRAHVTVTFTAMKLAQVVPPASEYAGKVIVVPIGSPRSLLQNPEYKTELVDAGQVRESLPRRHPASHKGSYGHLFALAGSRGKSGAALMTGLAALRSGAGLVTLWLPDSLQGDLVGKVPELMTESLPETAEGTADVSGVEKIMARLREADALVVGPGLTTAGPTRLLVRQLVRRAPVPVVLDADGLNAFASHPAEIENKEGQPVIVTPHPGEMARLLGRTIAGVQRDRIETARSCSMRYGWFTVLKGYQTIIASPMGQVLINSTGNPGMATGGSGDILAGVVGCLVGMWNRRFHGVNLEALTAHLAAAVYLHGMAGDLAAGEQGMESMIATDLLPYLPEAFKRTLRGR